jgi:signal transduction histidine kinase
MEEKRETKQPVGTFATLFFTLAIIVLIGSGWVASNNIHRISHNDGLVIHTQQVLDELRDILAALASAETSQRSYLLTGDPTYLEPYHAAADAVTRDVQTVRSLTIDNQSQTERIARLEPLVADRLTLLRQGVAMRDAQGIEGGRAFVQAGRGRLKMEAISSLLAEMRNEELRLLRVRDAESHASYRMALMTQYLTTLLGVGMVVAAYWLTARELATRRRGAEALNRANAELEKRVEQRTADLSATNEALERSNRELEQFASVASHDLQEPLRKIQAFGDRLQTRSSSVLGEQGRDYLARMQSSATRMRSLIDALLTFSRVTSKAQPFARVDLSATAAEVVSDLEDRIEETGARVEVGALPELEADPMQMRQLLQNLIGNGLKFRRPNESPVIELKSRLLPPLEGNGEIPRCELAVRDNGIGFEEIYLDRIFELFQRLHGRQEYEGTGMGLAICRKIVERHHGSITARSAPGEGATFFVTLPIRQT